MRRIIGFTCEAVTLWGTLDDAPAETGLLIVSGGNEIRIGAHRGMARLARDVGRAGFPVFRFDRRGIGDSEGENGGFRSSSADIDAALIAFREACPQVKRIIAFGNCDGATALLIHQNAGIDGAVLANIWTIEPHDELPPQAAIRARYKERLMDPKQWFRLVSGGVDIRALVRGLLRIVRPTPASSLASDVAGGLARFPGPLTLLLSTGDATALAFMSECERPVFDAARQRQDLMIVKVDSNSHSFATDSDYAQLLTAIKEMLSV